MQSPTPNSQVDAMDAYPYPPQSGEDLLAQIASDILELTKRLCDTLEFAHQQMNALPVAQRRTYEAREIRPLLERVDIFLSKLYHLRNSLLPRGGRN